jgi:hypothetical protein
MLATMSRGKRSAARHTPASLQKIADELDTLSASIRLCCARLKDNHLEGVNIPFQVSLIAGIDKLHAWTSSAKQAVGQAILSDVSGETDTVSEYDPDSDNPEE